MEEFNKNKYNPKIRKLAKSADEIVNNLKEKGTENTVPPFQEKTINIDNSQPKQLGVFSSMDYDDESYISRSQIAHAVHIFLLVLACIMFYKEYSLSFKIFFVMVFISSLVVYYIDELAIYDEKIETIVNGIRKIGNLTLGVGLVAMFLMKWVVISNVCFVIGVIALVISFLARVYYYIKIL